MNIQKALVVDDSKVAHLTLRKMLMERSIEVDWVGSGEDSIEYLKHQKPDLVLMDVMMPGLDGFETLRAINSDDSVNKPPVIMCSANATEEDRSMARENGAIGFLSKPYTTQELDNLLDQLRSSQAADTEVEMESETGGAEPLELPTEEAELPAVESADAGSTPPTLPELDTGAPTQQPAAPVIDEAELERKIRTIAEPLAQEIAEATARKNAEVTLHAARKASKSVAEDAIRAAAQQQPAIDPEQLRQSLRQELNEQVQQQVQQLQQELQQSVQRALNGNEVTQRLKQLASGTAQEAAARTVQDILAQQHTGEESDQAMSKASSAFTVGLVALVLALGALGLSVAGFLGLI
ncbi:MAG: response regulator [Candidatus Competibacterales bacterium]|nr:response regulator [Candidatus Competibacterales bacterium]